MRGSSLNFAISNIVLSMVIKIDEILELGLKAHRAGQNLEAESHYMAILNTEPQHAHANHNMGILGVGAGKQREAISFFKTAVEASPVIEQYWVSYIDTLLHLNEIDEAETALKEARVAGVKGDAFVEFERFVKERHRPTSMSISRDPPQHLFQSAIDLYKLGEVQKTLGLVDHLLDQYPHSAQLYNLQGIVESGLGDLDKAIDSFRQAIAFQRDHVNAHSNLGNTFTKKGELDEAINSYRQAITLRPDHANAHSNMGNALQEKGELNEAIKSYKQAIEIKPDFAEAFMNMGNAFHKTGELDLAIKGYKQAVKINPDFVLALNNMGVAHQKQGDLDAALSSYNQAIKVRPDYVESHLNMGLTLREIGDIDEAINSFRQAINIEPDHAHAYFSLGDALQDKGDFSSAINSYNQAINIKPDYAEAFYNLANAHQKKGDLDAAISGYKKALDIKPDYADAYCDMGRIYQEKGALSEAICNFEEAINLKPDFAEAFNNLAHAQQAKGELTDAIKNYQLAISIKPDLRTAWVNLFFALKAIGVSYNLSDPQLSLLREKELQKAAQIELSILRYQLGLGESQAGELLKGHINLLSSRQNTSIENPDADRRQIEVNQPLREKVIALTHCGRSGTNLFHSLVDGHPKLSILPSYFLSEFFDTLTWERLTKDGWRVMADRFIAMYPVLFDATAFFPVPTTGAKMVANMGHKEGLTSLGENKDEVLKVDKALFRKELCRLMTHYRRLDPFEFFKLIHQAYDIALGKFNQKPIIFYHIHGPSPHAKLNFVRFVPESNWLVMVREPLQSCESLARSSYVEKDYDGIIHAIVTMLFQIDNIVFHNERSVGLRLEDLKQRPKSVMAAICDWMGIEEAESLYEMTAQGKYWWGDLSSPDLRKDHMTPFGKASINRKLGSVFSDNDQFILRTLFYPFSVIFGYRDENLEQFKIDLKTIRPMLDEMFDFEKVLEKERHANDQNLLKSGSFQFFRACLISRWNTLNECHTYPNLLKPLAIDI